MWFVGHKFGWQFNNNTLYAVVLPVGPLEAMPVGPLAAMPVGPLEAIPVGPLKAIPVGL